MYNRTRFAAACRFSMGVLVILVFFVIGFSASANADDTRNVYGLTPQETLDLLNKQARQNFSTSNITQISPGVGISVHTQFLLDGWDTDIYVQEVEFNLMPDVVIHGVTLSTRSGGTSFLTGRLINEKFLSKLRRALENSSKTYVVAESRIRDVDTVIAGGSDAETPPKDAVYVGTGFVILDGSYIVTANHVVNNSKTISAVCGAEPPQSAGVLARDPANDIALLKVEKPLHYHLTLANEGSAHTGDKVFTIGFPLPELLGPEGKYSEGVISALSGLQGAANVMQITTPIQPGNSGGALVDGSGNVVGIVTSTAAARAFYETSGNLPQNINWAVKSEYLRPLLVRYMSTAISLPTDKEKLTPIERTEHATCFLKVTT